MSYQGGPGPGNGYDPNYNQHGYYQPQAQQNPYGSSNANQAPQQQPMTMQQMQYMQHYQPQNQAAYYQQPQYQQPGYIIAPNVYYPPPVHQQSQHYPQYVEHQQQQQAPQYQIPMQQSYQRPVEQYLQPQISPPPPPPQQSPAPILPPKKPSSKPTQTIPKASQAAPRPINQALLLVTLAEEYFTAAHELTGNLTSNMSAEGVDTYQKLIATGLGCLEASLRNSKLSPRMQANVRLRYAGVLLEETENYTEAEVALSKGIALCEQNRYFDLKYNMQFLLAKTLFKTSPKAALKGLDNNIADTEAYQHFSWVYAFRFLKASLSMSLNKLLDSHAAIQSLRSISALASQRNDRAIYLASSLMEIMTHMSSPTTESAEQAQRALAAAYTYQLDEGSRVPQLLCLTHLLDVACSFMYGLPAQTLPKLKTLQTMLDEHKSHESWNKSGDTIAIPIRGSNSQTQTVSRDTRGVIGISETGQEQLMLSFLTIQDANALTYLLSGIVLLHKNGTEPHKASKYLRGGVQLLAESRQGSTVHNVLPVAQESLKWRTVAACYCYIYQTFCCVTATDWKGARIELKRLEIAARELNSSERDLMECFYAYLSGICHQGLGELDSALEAYQDEKFHLHGTERASLLTAQQVKHDISILAALNSIWLLQQGPRRDLDRNNTLITNLEPICSNHPNVDIRTAFDLIKATVESNPPLPTIKSKNHLRSALDGAKKTANTQFLCFILNVMCSKFFTGVVGEQAEKSARAAAVQAQKTGSLLWMSVGTGMLAKCLEVQGKVMEAQSAYADANHLTGRALAKPS